MQNTLLLVDDDIELSGLLKEYFASEGFDVRPMTASRRSWSCASPGWTWSCWT